MSTDTPIAPIELSADAPPKGWNLEQMWPFVMATVGHRDDLLARTQGLELQLFGGEYASQRLMGGLAKTGTLMIGAIAVPLLVGMAGWTTVTIFGMEIPVEILVAAVLWGGSMILHYQGVSWSPLIMLAAAGALAAGIAIPVRDALVS